MPKSAETGSLTGFSKSGAPRSWMQFLRKTGANRGAREMGMFDLQG
jgi:hypothetical protein